MQLPQTPWPGWAQWEAAGWRAFIEPERRVPVIHALFTKGSGTCRLTTALQSQPELFQPITVLLRQIRMEKGSNGSVSSLLPMTPLALLLLLQLLFILYGAFKNKKKQRQ